MELIIEKLKKVRELAERGYAGEALVAREKLHMLLNKYGLTISDLEDTKTIRYKFKYITIQERSIMLQCISKVLDEPNLKYLHYKDKKKEFFIEMTEWQYAESQAMIHFHVALFRKELKAQLQALVNAYASKHDLFAESGKGQGGGKKLSPEELARLIKIYSSLDDKIFRKQLA